MKSERDEKHLLCKEKKQTKGGEKHGKLEEKSTEITSALVGLLVYYQLSTIRLTDLIKNV